jgi:ElaB/YqjD/DUF883 family membrane-anchored ribosome-binding protein
MIHKTQGAIMNDQNVTKSIVTPIKEGLHSAETAGAKALEDIKIQTALAASRLQVGFLKASGSTREMIHRRPLTTVLAGIGVGYLVGALMGLVIGRYSSKVAQP